MSDLESLVAEAEARFEALSRDALVAEQRARECRLEADKARAYADGIRAAQSAIPATRSRQKSGDHGSPRNRDMSPVWKLILRTVDDDTLGLPFDYDDLGRAAAQAGHDATRDTLRSQMSLYKARGIVETESAGQFTLSKAGRAAIALPTPVLAPTKKPVFGGGDFADDLDDDIPF